MDTIDLRTDTGGWKTVDQLIALHMLRDRDDRETHEALDGYVGMIGRNRELAIDHLQTSRDSVVYKCRGLHKKAIECLTLDPKHQNARENNWARIKQNAEKHVNSLVRQARLSTPDKLKEIIRPANKLLSAVSTETP